MQTTTAYVRFTRAAARFAGSGILFYFAVVAARISSQTGLAAWWWTPMAVLLTVSSALALIGSTFRSPRATSVAVVYSALAFIVILASWRLTWTGEHLGPFDSMWVTPFAGIVTLVTPIVWRLGLVLAYLSTVSFLGVLIDWTSRASHGFQSLPADVLWGISFTGMFTAGCVGLLRTGKVLDASAEAARSEASASAAARARASESRRFDGLLHDGVMATLLAAVRTADPQALARQAKTTLAQLESLNSPTDDNAEVPYEVALALVQSAVVEMDETAAVDVVLDDDAPGPYPAGVVNVIAAAVSEAVRNTARHAEATERAVIGKVSAGAIRFDVIDNGRGFDPDAVPAHRLGLRVSITGRLDETPGGWSTVRSERGRGTHVAVGWQRIA